MSSAQDSPPTNPDDGSVPASTGGSEDFIELGQVPRLGDYVRDLWARREFAVFVPYQELRVQKMNTVLGQLWHFLNPAMNFIVYYIIFGLILKVDRGLDNYIGFLMIGILLYTASNRIMSDAVRVIERDAGLIRSVEFPRALLPIAAANGQTMAFIPGVAVLFVALVITGEVPSPQWLLVVGPLVAHYLVNVGLALLLARAGFAFPDLNQIVEHLFRLLFYASGVLFLPEDFISNETVVRLFALNPLYDVIAATRWALMDLQTPLEVWVMLGIYTVLLPVAGLVVFMRGEREYGAKR